MIRLTLGASALALTAMASAAAAQTVGFSQIGSESGWRAAETTLTRQQAEERGIDLQFSDAQQKQENQIAAIRSFIAQGVDAILLAPVVATGWDAVLEEAKEAEIPVVLLDRQVDSAEDLYLTAVGSDLVHEGEVAGEWLVDDGRRRGMQRGRTAGHHRLVARPSTASRASRTPSPAMPTSRSSAARPATSPAPRARK